MGHILFLLGDTGRARNDNHQRLPAAFAEFGWQATARSHEAVRISAGDILIGDAAPADFDLIWPLGFGRQLSFLDRMQILKTLPEQQFVVSIDALTYLHGKHRWHDLLPETHSASDPATLLQALETGGQWVLKPTAGSYGRDVTLIENNASGRRTLQTAAAREPGSYLILQRYLPAIRHGEKRTLVAGGTRIGTYLRRPEQHASPPGRDRNVLKANLAANASAERAKLNAAETALVGRVASELAELGAGFAAIDTVDTSLMEVNVANPGGLATLAELGDGEASMRAVAAILRWKNLPLEPQTAGRAT